MENKADWLKKFWPKNLEIKTLFYHWTIYSQIDYTMYSPQLFIHQFIDEFTNKTHYPFTETAVLTADLKNLSQAKQIALNTKFPLPYIKVNLSLDLYPKSLNQFTVEGVKKIVSELLKGIGEPHPFENNSIYVKALFKKKASKNKIAEMNLSIYILGNELAADTSVFYENIRGGVKHLTKNWGKLENGVFTKWVDLYTELRVPLENFTPIEQLHAKPNDVNATIEQYESILSLQYNPILEAMIFTPEDEWYQDSYSYDPITQKAKLENDIGLWIYNNLDDLD